MPEVLLALMRRLNRDVAMVVGNLMPFLPPPLQQWRLMR